MRGGAVHQRIGVADSKCIIVVPVMLQRSFFAPEQYQGARTQRHPFIDIQRCIHRSICSLAPQTPAP
ncbi:MAG: hypothetical protein IKH95_07375 [Bacteroidaceae bacterium]|nr:hypothetical protein [Bacteroidaceae bacterium]